MLSGLNEKQREAATYLDSHLRIIAGAGSGKTRVLTYRMVYLIKEIGINPSSILAITFTNKAANEMRYRMEQLLDTPSSALLCTIHSFCVRVLRRHIRVLDFPTNFSIMDDDDQKALLKKIYKRLHIDSKMISYSSSLRYISSNKFANISIEKAKNNAGEFAGEKIKADIYAEYCDYQKEQFLLDFDDLLIKTVLIFKEYPEVLAYWQRIYNYIHVDEFQDVSKIEYSLIKLLTGENNILCVVGDPDQTIYSFRGADVSFIIQMDEDYDHLKTIYLNQNYRSSKFILDGANSVIANNKFRLEKDLFTKGDPGKKIIHYYADNEQLEGEYVIEKIDEIIANVDGINYRDFAILYRANYLSRTLEQAFINAKIPYRIFGGLKFFSRKEIKDAISYLQLVVRPHDLAFERIINTPGRGIGAKTLEKIAIVASNYQISLYETCCFYLNEIALSKKVKIEIVQLIEAIEKAKKSTKLLPDMFIELMNDVGYMEMLTLDQEETRIQNIKELQNSMANFLETNIDENTLDNYLQEIALYSSADDEEQGQFVSLMTIHMSKGLEFPYVFVIGLSENIFPSIRSLEEGNTGLEEERRLAYVAFTRAMNQLFLLDSNGYSFVSGGPKLTSRFIDEIDEGVVEHVGKKNRYKTSNYINPIKITKEELIGDNTISDWNKGELVYHEAFGKGVILSVSNDTLQIAFSMPYGIKTLLSNHKSLRKA